MTTVGEAEWRDWTEVQRAATRAWLVEDDLSAAFAILNRFSKESLAADLRREVIAFRGMLYQEQGNLESAKADYLAALRLADEGYVRFELEDTLAEVCKKLGEDQETDKWYSAALTTAAADPRVAGGGFLLRFLEYRDARGLSDEEQRLAEKIIQQGWHLLRVDGEPEPGDLAGNAKQLVEAQQERFSAGRPPAPRVPGEPVDDPTGSG